MLHNLARLSPITHDRSPDKPQLIDNACEGDAEIEDKMQQGGDELHKQNVEVKRCRAVREKPGEEQWSCGLSGSGDGGVEEAWG